MKENLIFDVGMCDGTDTEHYLKKGYQVVAVEADPVLVAKAEKRFRKFIDSGRLVIVNCGIAKEKGVADFYINEVYPIWNSFEERIAARDNLPYHKIPIECVTFDEVLKKFGVPYYLKIDIEGQDKYCINALEKHNLPKYISFEADNEGNTEMLDSVYELGFRKFKCINQNNFLPISIPYLFSFPEQNMRRKDVLYIKTRYGKNVILRALRKLKSREIVESLLSPSQYLTHEVGSSGPFGEETTGEWLTFDEVKALYLAAYQSYTQYKNHPSYGFWCDIHASF